MPGSQCSTVSESLSLPSSTSCSATTATNDFVMLPARKRSSGRSGRLLPRSATPAARALTVWPSLTSEIAPGDPALTTASSRCCRLGGAGGGPLLQARGRRGGGDRPLRRAVRSAAAGDEGRGGREQRGGEESRG